VRTVGPTSRESYVPCKTVSVETRFSNIEARVHVNVPIRSFVLMINTATTTEFYNSHLFLTYNLNPLKHSGIRWLHFEVFSTIHV